MRRGEQRTATGAGRRLRTPLLALLAAALLLGGIVVVPEPAEAAPRQSVSVDATVGNDRLVTVRVTCGAKSCRGKVTLRLSTGAKKTLSYRAAKRATKTLNWKLSVSSYRKFVSRGSAKLTVSGKAVKPRKTSFTRTATVKPAKAQLSLRQQSATIGEDRTVPLAMRCGASAGCTARVELRSSGSAIASAAVKTAKRGDVTVRLTVPAAQVPRLGDRAVHQLVIVESRPDAVRQVAALTLTKATPEPEPVPERTASVAYAQRNWTPTSYDTCPASLHEQYRTVGPDGKYYPTWHPAQVTDPATGELCTFGHEHGADPTESDIYQWVADFFSPSDLVEGEPQGLPFGYASEELDNHIAAGHSHLSMRHEDNGGHKVFLRNDVALVGDGHRNVTFENADGERERVVCDFLIKAHQGSWSPDATANNAHELIYAVRCNDGTELISTTLSRYGDPNEFNRSCASGTVVQTRFSQLPPATTAGGGRLIPDRGCAQAAVTAGSDIWSIYEVWMSANELTTADGAVVAAFDPWFGIRNPSRYYDSRTSTETSNGIGRPVDLLWEEGTAARAASVYPWSTVAGLERFDYRDPRSPFDGAQRDFYLGQNRVTGLPGSPGFYTDPYGGGARAEASQGAIRQWAVAGAVSADLSLERLQFDLNADWGKNNGVHAPN
ncbi:hypothetical protein J4H92_13585 [Leucobacter weissii]|uniref:Uncharacterized protein n=1 Tax=Leucobacter weissii TaxID=1983706 RepID=A0A939MU20_9MICO|nr:hypothetical protein [Leucobacter weissii]MBO1902974.1 hypothetical protein [Leucobacter weissii]